MSMPEPATKYALLPNVRDRRPTRHVYSHTERRVEKVDGSVVFDFIFNCTEGSGHRVWGNEVGVTVN